MNGGLGGGMIRNERGKAKGTSTYYILFSLLFGSTRGKKVLLAVDVEGGVVGGAAIELQK